MARAKKWNTKSKIVPALRRIWLHSPLRREAIKRAKDGDYYRCELCSSLQEKLYVDHITPAVSTEGWSGYDDFVMKLFCPPTELQSICESCHTVKTEEENRLRKENRHKRKNNEK
jgi:5-methylcytosine-specific restriction endonuclease McrA